MPSVKSFDANIAISGNFVLTGMFICKLKPLLVTICDDFPDVANGKRNSHEPNVMCSAKVVQGYTRRYTYNQLQVRPDNGKHR